MRDAILAGFVLTTAVAATGSSAGAMQREIVAGPALPFQAILAQNSPSANPAATVERAVTVVISGKVQGVGYRDWTVRRAKGLKIRGWVENAPDGTVRALFGGSDAAVSAILAECRRGPNGADVKDVKVTPAGNADIPANFTRRNWSPAQTGTCHPRASRGPSPRGEGSHHPSRGRFESPERSLRHTDCELRPGAFPKASAPTGRRRARAAGRTIPWPRGARHRH
jgi:acylphosphatase